MSRRRAGSGEVHFQWHHHRSSVFTAGSNSTSTKTDRWLASHVRRDNQLTHYFPAQEKAIIFDHPTWLIFFMDVKRISATVTLWGWEERWMDTMTSQGQAVVAEGGGFPGEAGGGRKGGHGMTRRGRSPTQQLKSNPCLLLLLLQLLCLVCVGHASASWWWVTARSFLPARVCVWMCFVPRQQAFRIPFVVSEKSYFKFKYLNFGDWLIW